MWNVKRYPDGQTMLGDWVSKREAKGWMIRHYRHGAPWLYARGIRFHLVYRRG